VPGQQPKTAGKKDEARRVPIQRSQGRTAGTGVHPGPAEAAEPEGQEKAVMPRDWSSRSLIHAPKRPIQLRTAWGAGSVAVLSEGSEACQVASERRRRSETSSSTAPERCSGGGFAWATGQCEWASWRGAPARIGAQGVCRERAKRADEESQSSFYYPVGGRGFWGKRGGGNLVFF
jgi:hypothetical protein